MKSKIFLIFASVLVLFGVILVMVKTIQDRTRVYDWGLLSDQPCEAPCWQNLIPGVSTYDEISFFIDGLKTSVWPVKEVSQEEFGCTKVKISSKPTRNGAVEDLVLFFIEENVLSFIITSPDGLTLSSVIDRFGPPEYQRALLVQGPEMSLFSLEVYYPQQGLAFRLEPTLNAETGQIAPDMTVNNVHYYQPADLLTYYTVRYSCDGGLDAALDNAEFEVGRVRPWSGFGETEVVVTR